jgi:hypothetical protein
MDAVGRCGQATVSLAVLSPLILGLAFKDKTLVVCCIDGFRVRI